MALTSPNTQTFDLHTVAARFGQQVRTPRWQITYLQRLVDNYNFPKPLPLMVADRMVDDVRRLSKWDRNAVNAWFEDRAPTTDGPGDPAARRMAEKDMDARAEKLGWSIVSGGRA